MTYQETLHSALHSLTGLAKLASQINPMSPAASGGFNVGGQNYQIDRGPQQQLSSNPADFNFGPKPTPAIAAAPPAPKAAPPAPQAAPPAPQAAPPALTGVDGKPLVFEPDDNAVSVPPSQFNMFKGTGTTQGATAGVPSAPSPVPSTTVKNQP